MNYKKILSLATLTLVLATGCVSKTIDPRSPAGTGDVDSSTPGTQSFESYKLPITRKNQKTIQVAYNFWSGEWPNPVIDVNSKNKGITTISAYTNLRNPQETDKVACTIQNGIYHPWSSKDPSSITYYSLAPISEYKVIKETSSELYNSRSKKFKKIKIPVGSTFSNIVYYGENLCGALYTVGKNTRPFSESCDFFEGNPDLTRTSQGDEFSEQWLYLSCSEKTADGKNLKAFVQDSDLISQPGIKKGCMEEYGKVSACKE